MGLLSKLIRSVMNNVFSTNLNNYLSVTISHGNIKPVLFERWLGTYKYFSKYLKKLSSLRNRGSKIKHARD